MTVDFLSNACSVYVRISISYLVDGAYSSNIPLPLGPLLCVSAVLLLVDGPPGLNVSDLLPCWLVAPSLTLNLCLQAFIAHQP